MYVTPHQRDADSIPFTTCVSSLTTMGAVVPLPSFSKAFLVAIRTILDARTGPQVRSHRAQTAIAPERMSPSPPQRFLPPSVLTIKDFRLLRMRSSLPFTNSVNPSQPQTPSIYCSSSLFLCFSSIPSTEMLRMSLRNVISRALGVRMVLSRLRSCMSSGCLLRQQMASASRTVRAPSGRFLMRMGKNSFMYLSLPRPGPITHALIAFLHARILPSHSPCASLSYSAESFTSASETKTGWTMISGEQALMHGEALLEQKMWARSPPVLREEMAAQKGAPVNSREPPMTATLPLSPLRSVETSGGKTPARTPNSSVLFAIISLYSCIQSEQSICGLFWRLYYRDSTTPRLLGLIGHIQQSKSESSSGGCSDDSIVVYNVGALGIVRQVRVAQWQSSGLLSRRLWVRFPSRMFFCIQQSQLWRNPIILHHVILLSPFWMDGTASL